MRTIKKLTTLLAVLLLFGVADMNAQGWLGGLKSQAGSSQKDNRLGTFDFSEFLTHCDYAVEDAGPAIAVLPVSYMESEAFINLQERLYHAIGNSPEFYDEAIKMHEGIIEMNKASGEDLSDIYEKLEELREMKKNLQPVDKKALRDEILSHAVCHKFFRRAEPLFEDMARVSSEYDPQKGWGVINAQGKTVIPFTHSEIYSPLFGEDDHMNVILGFNPDLGMSVYRTDGSLLTPQKFWGGEILPLRTLGVRFTKNTCGLMDENTGKILTTQKYEEIKDNLSNLLDNESTIIYGVRNGKNYILSKDGREIGELRMGDNTHEVIYY